MKQFEMHLESEKSLILEIADLSCKSMQLQSHILDLLKSSDPNAREKINEYQKGIQLLNKRIVYLKWEDIVRRNVPLSDITKGSQDFEIMEEAAQNGISAAQYSMGMWHEMVGGDYEEAEKWYNRAKENGHPSAEQALQDLKRKRNKL